MLNSITGFNELLFTVLNLILVATSIVFSYMLYIEFFLENLWCSLAFALSHALYICRFLGISCKQIFFQMVDLITLCDDVQSTIYLCQFACYCYSVFQCFIMALLHFAWVIDDAKCIVVMLVCVSVCLSTAACPYYCTDLDVTCGSGFGCPVVVHYWADLQSVDKLCCYGNIMWTQNVSEYVLVLALCLVTVTFNKYCAAFLSLVHS